MTLIEIINKLKSYTEGQYNNPKVLVGSLYENMNTKELTYPCVNIDNANAIRRDNEIIYNFYVYYADRLSESGDNMLQIQSEATTALQLMLNQMVDDETVTLDDYYNVVITPFKLKFTDVCAGAWMQVNIHTLAGIGCDTGIIPPEPLRKDYFYMQISENGGINFFNYNQNIDLEYSINGGEWIKYIYNVTIGISVQSGDTVYFRGDNPNGVAINDYYFLRFSVPKNTKLGGDILSLLSKDFSITRIPDWGFFRLFAYASVSEIDNIFKNVTHFGSNACDGMFENSLNNSDLSLTKAPEIPENATLSSGCFNYMFQRRKGLNYVKCLSTAISGDTYTKDWLKNVSGEGIFLKNINAEGWLIDSQDGIPLGWTVRNVDPHPVDPQWQSGYTSGYTDGFSSGYTSGHTDGYDEGVQESFQSGYTSGYTDGYTSGETDGYQSGYTSGSTDGFQNGYASGHTDGYNEGTADGFGSGYTSGYTDGYQVGYEEGEESVPLTSTSITENGVFSPSEGGWNEVEVNVSTGITPTGETTIFENGTYDVTNDATAIVQVPVDEYYQSGYTSGHTDGYNEGTADGFQSGYTSGWTTGFTSGFTSGYTSGNTDGFQSGYTSGYTNGYTSGETDGFQSGYTSGRTDGESAGFNEGYTSGYTDGYQSGHTDGVQSGFTSGYTSGYTSGHTDGYSEGYTSGHTDGVQSGFTSGYTSGSTDGFQNGYASGHTDGYNEGFDSGFTSGYTSGNTDGFQSGYTSGYTDGYSEGYTSGETVGFQSGYTSGYTSGHTDGYNKGYEDGEQSVPLTSTSITSNGVYVPSEGGWNSVTVNVPTGITPTGQTNILTNGTYDVTNVATAVVTVPQMPVQVLTQAEFNALTTKDPNTVYVINN